MAKKIVFLQTQIDDIVKMYTEEKVPLRTIAAKYSVSAPTISKTLMDAGEKIRPKGPRPKKVTRDIPGVVGMTEDEHEVEANKDENTRQELQSSHEQLVRDNGSGHDDVQTENQEAHDAEQELADAFDIERGPDRTIVNI